MSRKNQITKAIGAHGIWKARLQSAIEKGVMDKSADEIRKDNCCEFGQWLYGNELSSTEKESKYYQDVKELHAQFHIIAADVTELAIQNKTEEAKEKMASDYKRASSNLTRKMTAWMTA